MKAAIVIVSALFASASLANPFVKDPITHELERQLRLQMMVKAELLQQPDYAKAQAKYSRNLYKALIAEGFSEKQAFELLKAQLRSDNN
ncbi:MAG: hypothetical protein OIF35_10675 [Cellvibrionaceae bacterium]|nr:hypothetical protein [Cellvibrionaceae bacterium]MCV6625829.1 hypothetical protein [Cellvibrionaceae bacterium]